MYKNLIKERSEDFALEIIYLYKLLKDNNEFIISKQILRSGTSVGANISESSVASSKRDFLNKMFIAYKEAEETKYWLNLLKKSDYFSYIKNDLEKLRKALLEILKMLNKIVHQTRQNLLKNSAKQNN